jgi:hypothetical protein
MKIAKKQPLGRKRPRWKNEVREHITNSVGKEYAQKQNLWEGSEE